MVPITYNLRNLTQRMGTTLMTALGIALTGMVRDGEIDRTRAKAIAVMVLRGNAAQLYGIAPEHQ